VESNFYSKAFEIDKILSIGYNKSTEKELFVIIGFEKEYEEYIFKKISDVQWFYPLKEKGYFSSDKAPCPVKAEEKGYYRIPQWNVLPYLEKVSQQVSVPENEKYIDELLAIIKDVTRYHVEHDNILDNYRTWWYFVKILCSIPNEKIDDTILDLIPIWLGSKFDNTLPGADIATKLLPKFLNSNNPDDWKKVEKIIEGITVIKWVKLSQKTREKEPKTIIDSHWLMESFKENAIKIGEKCSEDVIFTIADRLKEVLGGYHLKRAKKVTDDYSYIWFRSLFEGPHYPVTSTKEALTLILRDVVLAKARKDKSATEVVFKKFLSSEYRYPIFKRIILFVMGNEWNFYGDGNIFWEIIGDKKKVLLFEDPNFEPEIYELLRRNINKFTPGEKEKIKGIIENGSQKKYLPTKDKEKRIAYWKQKWYSSMKSDTYFAPLYNEQKKITQIKEEISFKGLKVEWVGPGSSPLTKDNILQMSNKDLAKYLSTFKAEETWKGSPIDSLAETLMQVVKEKPGKFTEDLKCFLNVGYLYVYNILRGVREAWNEKRVINWGNLLEFIKEYIAKDDFWLDKYKMEKAEDVWEANHRWVTGIVGELVEDGTKDDDWAFSEDYFDIAKEILFLILDKQKVKREKEIQNVISYTLNSSFGKVLNSLICLALRIARVESKNVGEKEVKWPDDIKERFEKVLNDEVIEAYVLFDEFMPNFHYLDKKWVEEKIKRMLSVKSELWETFMNGYLYGSKIYTNLYELMKPHYLKAIDYEFKEKNIGERLVQHISIGYLRGREDFKEDSLFGKLLKKWKPAQIKEIIGFFWMEREPLRKPPKAVVATPAGPKVVEKIHKEQEKEPPLELEMRNRIIEFWRWVYENKYRNAKVSNEKDKKILSELSKLTVFLPKIDSENVNWLMLCAPYTRLHFDSPFFIEYLNELKDKDESSKYVGKIFLKILESSTPDFRKEHIRSIVEFLYKTGDEKNKKEADEICNIYGSRGLDFLRDLYEGYNKTQ